MARPDQRLPVRDAAVRLGVPDTTVRRWLDSGDLAGGQLPPDPAQRRTTPPPQWVSEASVEAMLAARAALADVPLAVTVGALKGGVGKSTTVWVLAGLLAGAGGRVLVVDADPNSQSLAVWANRYITAGGELPFRVLPWATHDLLAGVRPYLGDVDHLLIDTGPDGQDLTLLQAACRLAPLLLMPFAPRDIELGRLPATLEAARRGSQLTERPVWPAILLTRVALQSSASARARADLAAEPTLKELPVLDCEVRDRTIYTRMTAPLTTAEAGDYVGVLAELRALTVQIQAQEMP